MVFFEACLQDGSGFYWRRGAIKNFSRGPGVWINAENVQKYKDVQRCFFAISRKKSCAVTHLCLCKGTPFLQLVARKVVQ